MSSKRVRKQSKLLRCMSAPIRFLGHARDFYVQSLTGCAGHVTIGNAMGIPTPYVPDLPRSFSTNSNYTSDEDLRELIRVASIRQRNAKIEAETRNMSSLSRSKSVAIGRIDEHQAYEFGGEGAQPEGFTRSRSYAVSRKSRMMS